MVHLTVGLHPKMLMDKRAPGLCFVCRYTNSAGDEVRAKVAAVHAAGEIAGDEYVGRIRVVPNVFSTSMGCTARVGLGLLSHRTHYCFIFVHLYFDF